MRKSLSSRIAVATVGLLYGSLQAQPATHADPAPPGWKQTFADEFDGKEIDPKKWECDLGNGFYDYDAFQWIGGWGNGELQNYTRDPENVFLQDGMLHIRAKKEPANGFGFTSGRLKTRTRDGKPLFNQTYGRFEFRAKLPTGRGVWPALWLLPQDEKYGSWPMSGEIDVMEARGQEPNKVLGTLHYGARWPENTHTGKDYILPSNGTIADFHVYAIEWVPGSIKWFVDGKLTQEQTFWWSSSKFDAANKPLKPTKEADLNRWPAPFDQPFYLVMNVAVGGQFLGNPDKTTQFPAEMVVDYVRVYEKVDGYKAPPKRGEGNLPFVKKD